VGELRGVRGLSITTALRPQLHLRNTPSFSLNDPVPRRWPGGRTLAQFSGAFGLPM